MRIDDAALRALGVRDQDELDPLYELEPPTALEDRTLAAAPRLERAAHSGIHLSFSEVRVIEGVGTFRWWEQHQWTCVFTPEESLGPPVARAGVAAQLMADWELASYSGPAALRFEGAGEDDLIVAVCGGRVSVYRLRKDGIDPNTRFDPSPPVDLDAPELAGLLGPFSCSEWLRTRYAMLASVGAPEATASAVGMLGRLWEPEAADSRATFEGVQRESSPVERAHAWAKGLPEEAVAWIASAASVEIVRLAEGLGALRHAVSSAASHAGSALLGWLIARDELQSLEWALRVADPGRSLAAELDGLDSAARDEMSTFVLSGIDFGSSEHLRSVSWQEPDRWWGRLAVDE